MKNLYLEEFLALSKAENYGIAADSLYMSSSTLSRHILMLEEELGGQLFIREPRRVSLTKLGELFFPYADSIVEQLKDFRCKADMLIEKTIDTLSVCFANPISQYGLMEKLMTFRTARPSAYISFFEGVPALRAQMLKDDKCDFVIGYDYSLAGNSEFSTEVLIDDHLCIAMPPEHPLAACESVSLEQLRDCEFILNPKPMPYYKLCEELFAKAKFSPKVLMNLSNGSSIIDVVSSGRGISIVNRKRFEPVSGNYVLVDLVPRVEHPILLIYKKNREFSPLQGEFLEYMKNTEGK